MSRRCYESVIDEKRVTCGNYALAGAGLISWNLIHLDLMTDDAEFDNFDMVYITYYYYPKIDYEHWVTESRQNPLILQPTKERAIVEYILNEKWCDEGILIEALKSYLEFFRNDEELYEVADFFGLKREVLDYWITEAENDEDV